MPIEQVNIQAQTGVVPLQKRGIQNREAILQAAGELFGRHGFSGASTRAIAAAAGMEQGHLVYYFKTKDQLWYTVVDEFAVRLEGALARAHAGLAERPVEAARAALLDFLHMFADNPWLTRILIGELSLDSPRHDWLYENVGRRLWRAAEPIFMALHAQGLLSGAPAMMSYTNLVTGALLVFTNQREITMITGGHPIGTIDDHVDSLMRPIFAQGDQGRAPRLRDSDKAVSRKRVRPKA